MKIDHHQISSNINGENLKIAITLPHFNEKLGHELLENTKEELLNLGVKSENIQVIRIAGALETPFACKKIINKKNVDVIIALGIVIRGATSHYDLVNNTTHYGLMKLQLENNIPIIFGFLTCENLAQVEERISKTQLNKGKEFAEAAILQGNL